MFKILPMCGCQKLSLSGNRRKSFFHFFLSFQRGCSIWIWKEKEKVPRILQKCRGQTSHQITHLFVVMDQNHDWVKNNVNIEAAMSMGGTTTHQDRRSNKCNQHEYMSIWGCIWKHVVGKSNTNATSVTMHALSRVHWEVIWKPTVGKIKKMQPMRLCILLWKRFEETF